MTLINQIKEKREERKRILEAAGAILTLAANEEREMTAEENQEFDARHADGDKLLEQIERLERQRDAESSLGDVADIRTAGREALANADIEVRDVDSAELYEEAFGKYVRYGMGGLNTDERSAMASHFSADVRAQSAGTDSEGGYTVPEGFSGQLEKALLDYSAMLNTSTVFTTSTGADLPWPTTNDTSNKGALLAENAQAGSATDVTFGAVTFESFMYTSTIVKVSLQLLQDSAFDMNVVLADLLGERLGRIINEHATTGTGSGQPNGIVTASTLGDTAASATAVTYQELVDLQHSVDPAYRRMPGAGWMMADASLANIKKIVDGDSRPLWSAGLSSADPDTILGQPYTVNQDMPAMATGLKSILYGDLSKYYIRRVNGIQLMRLTERYADYLQVGFVAFLRWDGDLLNAGTNPVKHLIQA